jgi:hypothetical protein
MPDESAPFTNEQWILLAKHGIRKLARLEEQYRTAKVSLANGDELTITPSQITALKQKFAIVRSEVKDALDAVTTT